jgi:uncharacterized membrane protein
VERSNLDNQKSLGTDASTASVAAEGEDQLRESVGGCSGSACVFRYRGGEPSWKGRAEQEFLRGEAADEERWRCEVPSKETSDGSKRSRSRGAFSRRAEVWSGAIKPGAIPGFVEGPLSARPVANRI